MSNNNKVEEFVKILREKLIKNIGYANMTKNRNTIENIYIPLYSYLNSIHPDFIRLRRLADLPAFKLCDENNIFHLANFLCGIGLAERRNMGNAIYIRSIPLESVKTDIGQTEITKKEIEKTKERRKPQEI